MPKVDIKAAPVTTGSTYPPPFDKPCHGREIRRLGQAAGLTQFGVNMVRMAPGAWSSQRHWHALEDEFVVVLSGELVLVEDGGETVLRAGDCAGFKAGVRNGHHLQNRSGAEAVYVAIGSRDNADWGEYSDIDMTFAPGRYAGGRGHYKRKDGTSY
jgi:uncharacterized cupin superfamily protein